VAGNSQRRWSFELLLRGGLGAPREILRRFRQSHQPRGGEVARADGEVFLERREGGEVEGEALAHELDAAAELRAVEVGVDEVAPLVHDGVGGGEERLVGRAERGGDGVFVVAVGADDAAEHAGGGIEVALALVGLGEGEEGLDLVGQGGDGAGHAEGVGELLVEASGADAAACEALVDFEELLVDGGAEIDVLGGDGGEALVHEGGRLVEAAFAEGHLGAGEEAVGVAAAGDGALHRVAAVDHGGLPRAEAQLEGRAVALERHPREGQEVRMLVHGHVVDDHLLELGEEVDRLVVLVRHRFEGLDGIGDVEGEGAVDVGEDGAVDVVAAGDDLSLIEVHGGEVGGPAEDGPAEVGEAGRVEAAVRGEERAGGGLVPVAVDGDAGVLAVLGAGRPVVHDGLGVAGHEVGRGPGVLARLGVDEVHLALAAAVDHGELPVAGLAEEVGGAAGRLLEADSVVGLFAVARELGLAPAHLARPAVEAEHEFRVDGQHVEALADEQRPLVEPEHRPVGPRQHAGVLDHLSLAELARGVVDAVGPGVVGIAHHPLDAAREGVEGRHGAGVGAVVDGALVVEGRGGEAADAVPPPLGHLARELAGAEARDGLPP